MPIQIKYKDRWLSLNKDATIDIEDNSQNYDKNHDRNNITYTFLVPATQWQELTRLGATAIQYHTSRGYIAPGFEIYSDGVLVKAGWMKIRAMKKNLNNPAADMVEAMFMEKKRAIQELFVKHNIRELTMDGVRTIAGGNLPPEWPHGVIDVSEPYGPKHEHFEVEPITTTSDYAKDIVLNGDDYICFPMILFERLLPENTYNKYANFWYNNTLGFLPVVKNLYSGFNPINEDNIYVFTPVNKSLIPCYYLHKVLEHIFSENGFVVDYSEIDSEHFRRIALINNYSILKQKLGRYISNFPASDMSGEYFFHEKIIYYAEDTTTIDPKNHLPDVEVWEFIEQINKRFNCYIDVEDNVVYFKKAHDGTYEDLSDTLTGEVDIETNYNTGYELRYKYKREDVVGYPYLDLTYYNYREFEDINDVSTYVGEAMVHSYNNIYDIDSGGNLTLVNSNLMNYKNQIRTGIYVEIDYPAVENTIRKLFFTDDCLVPRIGCDMTYHLPMIADYRRQDTLTEKIFGPDGNVIESVHVIRGYEAYTAFYFGLTNTLSARQYPCALNTCLLPTPSGGSIVKGNFNLSFRGKYSLTDVWFGVDKHINNGDLVIFKMPATYEILKRLKMNKRYIINHRLYKLNKVVYQLPLRDVIRAEFEELLY